jgi:hypothetical protein
LVTFSGEAEKVTARRVGALQREAAKLRPNYKHSNLRRRKHACTQVKAKQNGEANDGRPERSPLRPPKSPAATATRDVEDAVPYRDEALKKDKSLQTQPPASQKTRLHPNKCKNQPAPPRTRGCSTPPSSPKLNKKTYSQQTPR